MTTRRTRFHPTLVLPFVSHALAGAAAVVGLSGRPAAAEGPIDWNQARKHWSFWLPQAHAAPTVRRKDWPRQPLDFFILARLEQSRLSPSPEADPRTLVRWVT